MARVKTCNKKFQSNSDDPFSKLMQYSMNKCKNLSDQVDYYCDEYGIYIVLENALRNLAENPLMAIAIILTIVACALPLIMFTIFALVTVFLTFSGFLIIEGTLLTVASFMLLSFLAIVGLGIVFMGGTVIVGYVGLSYVYDTFIKDKNN